MWFWNLSGVLSQHLTQMPVVIANDKMVNFEFDHSERLTNLSCIMHIFLRGISKPRQEDKNYYGSGIFDEGQHITTSCTIQ